MVTFVSQTAWRQLQLAANWKKANEKRDTRENRIILILELKFCTRHANFWHLTALIVVCLVQIRIKWALKTYYLFNFHLLLHLIPSHHFFHSFLFDSIVVVVVVIVMLFLFQMFLSKMKSSTYVISKWVLIVLEWLLYVWTAARIKLKFFNTSKLNDA